MDAEKTLLCGEIKRQYEKLEEMEAGTEAYRNTTDAITKLTDRLIEIEKFERDTVVKEKQMTEEKKDRTIKNVLTGLGIGVPAILTVWGTLKSINFEKTGTITTIMGRGFINKLLPKK